VKLRPCSFGLLFVLIVTFTLFCSGCTTPSSSGGNNPGELVPGVLYQALVTHVVDGDTFDVQFTGGNTERIRVLGVDTPETTAGANNGGEYGNINDTVLLAGWGVYARNEARTLLEGKKVSLETDGLAGTKDRYGRILAYVTMPDGGDFGAFLLGEGLARVYTAESFSRKTDYLRLEQVARSEGTGLWGDLPPAGWSAATNTLVPPSPEITQDPGSAHSPGVIPDTTLPPAGPYILEVIYDPPGDDRTDPNGEYIILSNAGPEDTDLAGWRVREGGGVAFTFPRVLVPPGDAIELHTGRGAGNSTSLYWNRTAPFLNNDGDTVTLIDPSGTVVSTFTWG
jgi:micrococcal nuclease